MGKTKMRCNTCGKWFQSANAKDLTCPDCVQKARKEKATAKNAPPAATKSTTISAQSKASVPPPPPKPKSAGGTNQWLDSVSDVKIGQPDQPQRPKLPPSPPVPRDTRGGSEYHEREDDHQGPPGPGNYRDERGNRGDRGDRGERSPRPYQNDRGPGGYREGNNRGPGAYRENDYHGPGAYRVIGGAGLSGTLGQRPRQPMEGGPGRGPRPGGPDGEQRFDRSRPGGRGGPREGKPNVQRSNPKPKASKPAQPPKPKREKIPPPPPFMPTAEQTAQVENRYLELAQPIEFDGIRTQIAQELGIPKTAVKKIIKELRDRQDIPSWWELQVYKGSEEELARIKATYEPFLPVPAVGIHKKIAEELSLKPGDVYQAIKAIRQELNLPQYNDPSFHEEELAAIRKAREERAAARAAKAAEAAAAAEAAKATTTPVAEEQPTEANASVAEAPSAEAITTTPSAEEPSAEATAATTPETEIKEVQGAEATDTPSAETVVTVSGDEKDKQESTPHI